MKHHITVNGKPYCQCRPEHLFPHSEDPFGALFQMQNDAHARGVFVVCMCSEPNDEAAVRLLNEHGIPAEVTDGVCPTLLESLDDSNP